MTKTFQIKGLSKPHSVTLEHDNHLFWATSMLPEPTFESLFKYVKNDWDEPKYAILEYHEVSEDGTPIDAMMIGITLEPFDF